MTEKRRLYPHSDRVRVINRETGRPFSLEGDVVIVTPEIERRMREGLLVPELPGAESEEPDSAVEELMAMKVQELLDLAAAHELEPPAGAKKADLVEFLAAELAHEEG